MKKNYHTHNELCGHATGCVEDYVKTAVECGYEELGLSDHIPFKGDTLSERMPYAMLDYYLDTIVQLKGKYDGKIQLYSGLEAEYFPSLNKYYEELLCNEKIEYMILGQHYILKKDGTLADVFLDLTDSKEAVTYANSSMEAMKTGYFTYFAHPDLFLIGDFTPDYNTEKACDIILNEAVKYDYILELNANGLRKPKVTYTGPYFWEKVAQTNIRVILGADAHTTDALHDEAIKKAETMARELKLNVIDTPFQ